MTSWAVTIGNEIAAARATQPSGGDREARGPEPAEAVPCRSCGAVAGSPCVSKAGRPSPVVHALRKIDRAAHGRDPEETARELGRHLVALRYLAADGKAQRRQGGWATCVRSKQTISPVTMLALEQVGAAAPGGAGWTVTEFGRKVAAAEIE